MKDPYFLLSFIVSYGYIFYVLMGKFASRHSQQYYNKLRQTRPYLLNLAIAILFCVVGIWRVSAFDTREVSYFAPLIFLFLFRFINYISMITNKRPLIVATRWDKSGKGKYGINWIDRCLSFLLLLIPMIVPGLIMNKLNFGHFM